MLNSLRTKTYKDLRANRGQYFAVWLVVMLGVAFYGALYPAGVNMLASFHQTEDQLSYMHFQASFSRTTGTDLADAIAQVAALDDVERVEPRLSVDAGWQPDPTSDYQVTLRLIEDPTHINLHDLTRGAAISGPDDILLLESFANHQGIQPGDRLTVWLGDDMRELRVAGLVFNPEYMIAGRSPAFPVPTPSTFGVAWMGGDALRAFAGVPDGTINALLVHLRGKAANMTDTTLEAARADLTRILGHLDGFALLRADETASGGMVNSLVQGNFPLMAVYSGVFLLGSVVMTSVLLGRVVQGERQRIGTLRALGVTRRELVTHYLSFGLIIGLTGGAVGVVFGYLNSLWVMWVFMQLIIGATVPAFSFAPQIPFLTLGFVVAVVGSVLAGIYPAWVESATAPGEALRPPAPAAPNRVSRMKLDFLPLPLRRAIRNILRSPGRSISTALGVGLGALMVFSAYAMWDTNETAMAAYFGATNYDLRVDYDPNRILTAQAVTEQAAGLPGVTQAQAALAGPMTVITASGERFDTFGVMTPAGQSFFDLTALSGDTPLSHDDGVWIGHNLAWTLGVSAGDTVTLQVLGMGQDVTVSGVISQAFGAPVYVPQALGTALLPGDAPLANTALLRVPAGEQQAARDAAMALPGVVGVEIMATFDSDMNDYLLFFRVGTLIFAGFGYVLTLAVLFNTVNAGMIERVRELSVLRALGSSSREIALVVLLELLLMTLLGIVMGVPLGQWMGFELIASYDTPVFSSPRTMTLLSLLVGVVSLTAIVVFATLPGLRRVQHVDLGAVSKAVG